MPVLRRPWPLRSQTITAAGFGSGKKAAVDIATAGWKTEAGSLAVVVIEDADVYGISMRCNDREIHATHARNSSQRGRPSRLHGKWDARRHSGS
jgi:hypothetical protein